MTSAINVRKDLNKMAIPLIAQSLTSIFFSVFSQIIVGRTNIDTFTAVNAINAIIYILLGFSGYFGVAFQIKMANLHDSERNEKMSNYFCASFIMSLFIGLVFLIIGGFFGKLIISNYFGFNGNLLNKTYTFSLFTCIYFVIQMIIFVFNGYYRLIKKTKVMFIASLLSMIVDAISTVLFVIVFNMDVIGFGVSLILSTLIYLCVYIIEAIKLKDLYFKKFTFNEIKEIVNITLPLIIQEFLDNTLFILLFNSLVAHISPLIYASYLLVNNIISYLNLPTFMYGSSLLTFVGEEHAKKNIIKIKKYTVTSLKIVCTIFIVGILFILLFKTPIIGIFSDQVNIINQTKEILLIILFSQILHPVWQIYKYSVQGFGEGKQLIIPTLIINLIAITFLYLGVYILNLNINFACIGLFLNFLLLSIWFNRLYNKQLIKMAISKTS
ncbi:MATE family efflux transporter [Terrilactibacillus laevilacticus]|uniref:MATE family efflux transporter n=1 Tax=Terrilactibacillus laevilacticus TaxID=1380157 RepID=UPI0011463145|nr:MATE family efflux transporter [Terrilactibacillus laevilacticus]